MYNHRTGKNISGFKVKDFQVLKFGICGINFYEVIHIETKKQVNTKGEINVKIDGINIQRSAEMQYIPS